MMRLKRFIVDCSSTSQNQYIDQTSKHEAQILGSLKIWLGVRQLCESSAKVIYKANISICKTTKI